MEGTPRPRVFKKEDLIPVPEFAKRLGISRSYAYRLAERGPSGGGVLAFRFGTRGAIRVPVTEVDRFRRDCLVEEI